MRLRRTYSDRFSSLYSEVADGQASAPADIQKHKLIIRLSSHTASILRLRRRKGNDLKRRLFFSLRQFEVLDLRVAILQPI